MNAIKIFTLNGRIIKISTFLNVNYFQGTTLKYLYDKIYEIKESIIKCIFLYLRSKV